MTPVRSGEDPIVRIRALCLALPEAVEQPFGGHTAPSFRVRDKLFAMYADDVHGDGRTAVWLNAEAATQRQFVDSDPERFFSPPYVGCKEPGVVGKSADWVSPVT